MCLVYDIQKKSDSKGQNKKNKKTTTGFCVLTLKGESIFH